MKLNKLFAVLGLAVFFACADISTVSAQAVLPAGDTGLMRNERGELRFPGTVKGVSKSFQITDSKYLNISLDSSEIINAHIESVPHMILMHLEPSTAATSALFTIKNLKPLTIFYLYQDSHKNLTVFTSDILGSYSYTQDLTSRHLVFIKPEPSTKYITDNATGGDCTTIGTWNNSTKTCTLTTNLTETIEITSNGIIFDGNNYSIIKSGTMTGHGIFAYQRTNITIKNIEIKNFSLGVSVQDSDDSIVSNVNANNNWIGIAVGSASSGNMINGNQVNNNDEAGISLHNSADNLILQNTASSNTNVGIVLGSTSSENILTYNNISNNGRGIVIDGSNNEFYNNNFINNPTQVDIISGSSGNFFNRSLPIGGNYWSNFDSVGEGCTDVNTDNICDSVYSFASGQDNFPWKTSNLWYIPTASSFGQYKSDVSKTISPGGITTESWSSDPLKGITSFAADVSDNQNDQVKLEVEIKPVGQSFDGLNTTLGNLVNSGMRASVTKTNLLEGSYKWRARVLDSNNNTSDWQHFGDSSDTADFVVKLVPLYTQRASDYNYPTNIIDQWADDNYGNGNYSCRNKITGKSDIAACGCFITSAVMLFKYYNPNMTTQGNEINPRYFNNWLKMNDGYNASGGILSWDNVSMYSKNINGKVRLNWDNLATNTSILEDSYLATNKPVIAKHKISSTVDHFIVINGKLADYAGKKNYSINDPYWYRTTRLNNQVIDDPDEQKNYNGNYSALVYYTYYPGGVAMTPSATFILSSPAEFLITAPDGKRIGKDPTNNTEYNEIPDAHYEEEGIGNPDSLDIGHITKRLTISNPLDGNYVIKVIGTGEGSYTVDSHIADSNGNSHSEAFVGNIRKGVITEYNLDYDLSLSENIQIEPIDQIAPITTIAISGTGNNDWYAEGALVTLSAADNTGGVGIWKTEYSLDGGVSWTTYISPFIPPEGELIVIKYRSEDYIGNIETVQTSTFKVDLTPPEGKIHFNHDAKYFSIDGFDNLSATTTTKINNEKYIVSDEAGNMLKINLSPIYTSPHITAGSAITETDALLDVILKTLQYNSGPVIKLPINNIQYTWTNTFINNQSKIRTLQQSLAILGKVLLSSTYDLIVNKTILNKTENTTNITQFVNGMVLLNVATNKGKLDFQY